MAWLGWTGFGDPDGFAVDGAHDSFPAGQGFLEIQLDCRDETVALAFERGMLFL